MQKTFFICFFALLLGQVSAQQFTTGTDSDPEARAVLEAMRQKYEGFGTLQADFSLEIEVPQQSTTTQKGMLIQQGDKYRLQLDGRTIVSDGTSVWLYAADAQEVEINDAEEDGGSGGLTSPKDLLRAYEWNDYIYVLSQEFAQAGRVVQQIEFKPVSRDSDFSKIRLTLDKETKEVIRIKSFAKDGSRFTLQMQKLQTNLTVPASTFTFSEKECPSCHFEDLRLN